MSDAGKSAQETIAKNTTILVWALVWIPLAIVTVFAVVWGISAITEHHAEAKAAEKVQQQAAADAAYQQAKAARIQPVRDALQQVGYDVTTPRAGYGSVENFVGSECDHFRMGLSVNQEAQGLAGSVPMPVSSALTVLDAVVSSGACN